MVYIRSKCILPFTVDPHTQLIMLTLFLCIIFYDATYADADVQLRCTFLSVFNTR